MPGTAVTVPTFRWRGRYFPEIFQSLLDYVRINLPELTDEDPHEPMIQLLRAFALASHWDGLLADHIALESQFGSCRKRQSAANALALIGERLLQAVPAVADVVYRLASPLTASQDVLEPRSQVRAPRSGSREQITYETADSLVAMTRTDRPTKVLEYRAAGGIYTDVTANFIAAVAGVIWAGAPAAGDALYLGHSEVMVDEINLDFDMVAPLPSCLISTSYRALEYYANHFSLDHPTFVGRLGATIRFNLNGFLGTLDRHGSTVKVRCSTTGIEETIVTTWAGGGNRADTTGLLGQGVPSTLASDYPVTAEWREVEISKDEVETVGTLQRLKLGFTLPETLLRSWPLTTIQSTSAEWLRLRVINVDVTSPTLKGGNWTPNKQYYRTTVTQGRSVSDDPNGSTTGYADQSFTTRQGDVIEGTVQVFIDEGSGLVEWTEVDNFLSSLPTSRVFRIAGYDINGAAMIRFGDGQTGRVPVSGTDNLRIDYRVDAVEDGNLGAAEINEVVGGSRWFATVQNPRPATGWAEPEGASPTGLAQIKISKPAAFRANSKILTTDDAQTLVEAWATEDGSKPIARASAVQGAIPKVILITVAGPGGVAVPASILADLDLYLNGNPLTGYGGVTVVNNRCQVQNFTPYVVNITATVNVRLVGGEVPDPDDLTASITAALQDALSPLALRQDGTYEFNGGDTIFRSKLATLIMDADRDAIDDVIVTVPAASPTLGQYEWPVLGTVALSFTI